MSGQQVALQFAEKVVLPTVYGQASLDMPCITGTAVRYDDPEALLDLLWDVGARCPAYCPHGVVLDGGMIHAVLLEDTRLVCVLSSPVDMGMVDGVSGLELVANDTLTTSFMGIRGNSPLPGSEMDVALQGGHQVNHVFRLALSCIYGWARTGLAWQKTVGISDYVRRRVAIQRNFVEPALRNLDEINPIPQYVMCALLVAYCDHNPNLTRWTLIARSKQEDAEDALHRQSISAVLEHEEMLSFDSPKQYLEWLARLE